MSGKINLKENSDFDVRKVRFRLSTGYRAPPIPIRGISKDFYHSRLNELDFCFEELKEKINNIDPSTKEGYSDLLKAANVSEQLRCYKIDLEFKVSGKVATNNSTVPYTSRSNHESSKGKR